MCFRRKDSRDETLFSGTFASGSEKFVSEWLLPFLQKTYGSEYKTMKPHGIVVLDMPMEYNATEGTQTIIGPVGAEKEVMFPMFEPLLHETTTVSSRTSNSRGSKHWDH